MIFFSFYLFIYLFYFFELPLELNGLTDIITPLTGIILICVPRFVGFDLGFR